MNNNFELKIYEKLGVKQFKKMAFGLRKVLLYPSIRKMSNDEKDKFLSAPSNYNIKKGNRLEDLKDFKKYLLFNSSIHILGSYLSISLLFHTITIFSMIVFLSTIIINGYCIMLQRYNWIRINQIIKKYGPYEEKKKEKIKEEIREKLGKTDEFILDFVHTPTNKNIIVEQLTEKADLKQLKEIRNYLEVLKNYQNNDFYDPLNDEDAKVKIIK